MDGCSDFQTPGIDWFGDRLEGLESCISLELNEQVVRESASLSEKKSVSQIESRAGQRVDTQPKW